MKFVIASNNKKKIREMKDILSSLDIEAVSMADAGVFADPDESGETFEENALIKARTVMERSGLPAIADDSGLSVDALSGAPGVHSARYAEGTDADRTRKLLSNMRGVKKEDRGAKFVSAIACAFPDGDFFICRGECEGEILFGMQGEGGFGYDPVFFVPEYRMTFAQMPAEVKNKISHRAKAMEKMRDELKKRMA